MPEPPEALPILSTISARRTGVVISRLRESEGIQKISSPPVLLSSGKGEAEGAG